LCSLSTAEAYEIVRNVFRKLFSTSQHIETETTDSPMDCQPSEPAFLDPSSLPRVCSTSHTARFSAASDESEKSVATRILAPSLDFHDPGTRIARKWLAAGDHDGQS
jgi:hypothetical protein